MLGTSERGSSRASRYLGLVLAFAWGAQICLPVQLGGWGHDDSNDGNDSDNSNSMLKNSYRQLTTLPFGSAESEETCHVNGLADPLGNSLDQWYDSLIYFLGCFYLFYGLGFVCEEYFVAAIERIISEYSIPPDVAGATLMAAGSSSPELFAAIVGIFMSEDSAAGTGTVVGSAIFNQLFMLGGALILSPTPSIELDLAPIVREILFYFISACWLYVVFVDGKIVWWESWGMLVSYIIYILVNAYWGKILKLSFMKVLDRNSADFGGDLSMHFEGGQKSLTEELLADNYETSDAYAMPLSATNAAALSDKRRRTHSNYGSDGQYHWDTDELAVGMSKGARSSVNPASRELATSALGRYVKFVTYPLVLLLSCILVDCKKYPKRYFVSFFCSICVLGLIVFFIIQWIEKAGCLIGLGPALMGLTFGAAGTSSPDALVTFHVARNGLGDVAFSNALGSNIFNFLIGLALPWTIKTTILGDTVEVDFEGFKYTFFYMLGALLFLVLVLMGCYMRHGRIVMSRKIGYFKVLLYFSYIAFAALNCETDLFGK